MIKRKYTVFEVAIDGVHHTFITHSFGGEGTLMAIASIKKLSYRWIGVRYYTIPSNDVAMMDRFVVGTLESMYVPDDWVRTTQPNWN